MSQLLQLYVYLPFCPKCGRYPNLRSLVDEAAALVRTFGRCDLVKVPRDEIVRVLGH